MSSTNIAERSWRPRRLVVTRAARGFGHGRAIIARAAAARVEVVELPGDRLSLALQATWVVNGHAYALGGRLLPGHGKRLLTG